MAYRGNDDSVHDDDAADGGDVSQETLIVWSEGDNRDFGLSFEQKKGCSLGDRVDSGENFCSQNSRVQVIGAAIAGIMHSSN